MNPNEILIAYTTKNGQAFAKEIYAKDRQAVIDRCQATGWDRPTFYQPSFYALPVEPVRING